MIEALKRYFSPPVFADDPEKTRAARVLNTILTAFFISLLASAIGVIFIFIDKTNSSIVTLFLFALCFFTRGLMRRGKVYLASLVVITALWLIFTFQIVLAGGMTSIVPVFYLSGTVIAGLLLGMNAALTFGGASILAGLVMVLLETGGRPLPHFYPMPPQTGLVNLALAIGITVLVLNITLTGLKDALAKVEKEKKDLEKTEKALEVTEARYRLLAETTRDVIWIVDLTGKLTYVSPSMTALRGFPVEEVMQQKLEDSLTAASAQLARKVLQTIAESAGLGPPLPALELEHTRKDGSTVWTEAAVTVMRDSSGKPSAVLGVSRDISARKQAEDEIRLRNLELEAVSKILAGVTTRLDLKQILEHALDGMLELTGMEGGTLCMVDHEHMALSLSAARSASPEMENELASSEVKFGDCLCGYAAQTGEPFILWDNASGSEFATREAVRGEGIRFHAAFPLVVKGKSIGVVCIFSRTDARPSQRSLDLVRDLCSSVALAVENARLYGSAVQEKTRAEVVARISSHINSQLNLQNVLNIVCEEAARALYVPAANVFLFDEQSRDFKIQADFGFPANFRLRHQAAHFDEVRDSLGGKDTVEDVNLLPRNIPNVSLYVEEGIRTILGARIMDGGKTIGVLNVFTRGSVRRFTDEERSLLRELANHAAGAIINSRLYEQVNAGRKHLRILSQQLMGIQEAERRALALELHDELGQLLSSTKMSLEMIPNLPAAAAREQLERAQALVGDLVARVRRMSLDLRPSMLDDMGLLPTLRWFFKNYQAQTGEAVSFDQSHLERRFPPDVEITTYRIVQEALTNVIRHAENKQVSVSAWADKVSLNIQIIDQGVGFNPAAVLSRQESSGLSGMRERARLIGGDLVVESNPGSGTSLTARFPLESEAANKKTEES